jgi:hypothetical protein
MPQGLRVCSGAHGEAVHSARNTKPQYHATTRQRCYAQPTKTRERPRPELSRRKHRANAASASGSSLGERLYRQAASRSPAAIGHIYGAETLKHCADVCRLDASEWILGKRIEDLPEKNRMLDGHGTLVRGQPAQPFIYKFSADISDHSRISRRLHISRGRGLGVIAPALQAGGRGFDTIFGARCSKIE